MLKLSSSSIVHIKVLEKELEVLKTRRKDQFSTGDFVLPAFYDVVDYFERRIKELNESND